jgi:hypothetical protein
MIQMIKDGNEDLIRSATAYVEKLGVPRKDIHALSVGGTVGGPLTIIVEIYVEKPKPRHEAPAEDTTDEMLPITIERGSDNA